MDRSEIRRKALLAATTVTLALAPPAACTVVDVEKPDDTDEGRTADSDVAADTEPATGADETGAVDSSVAETDVVDTDLPDTDAPDTDVATDTAFAGRPDCVALGLDLSACCDALHDWCDDVVAVDTEAYNTCVFGPSFSGSTGCIPWGPPVPPRFRGAVA